ncbi:MAG: YhfC family glutamic-type intramembrane protease, partial [Chloroflexota bacterium]
MPLFLGWFIARRRSVSWRLFAIGAATFILAQIVHIPFNYWVLNQWLAELSFSSQWTQLIVTAVFLGLSAGFFEEGTRYLAYRFWAKDARTWGSGLMMGAGHGGVESILLGIVGALNITILVGYGSGYFQDLIPSEQAPQVEQALEL